MPDTLNIDELLKQAKDSPHKESYTMLHRTQGYRIGVGARLTSPTAPSFFLETIIALTNESKEVDLKRLEQVLNALKTLKSKGYSLAYDDGNCISCEATKECQDLQGEYRTLKTLMKTTLDC